MVAKVNVSLPEKVLTELDRAAREAHVTRSALLVKAITRFLEEQEEEHRRQKRVRAAANMDRFREQYGDWDGTAEVLKWRDLH